MLALEALDVYYGEIRALRSVALDVRSGEIVTLLGNNGAGKSTTLKTISGLLAPRNLYPFGPDKVDEAPELTAAVCEEDRNVQLPGLGGPAFK